MTLADYFVYESICNYACSYYCAVFRSLYSSYLLCLIDHILCTLAGKLQLYMYNIIVLIIILGFYTCAFDCILALITTPYHCV